MTAAHLQPSFWALSGAGGELAKDESILQLLADLAPDTRGWCLVDHWEADRVAIGLASPRHPRRLVYVSAALSEPGRWYHECEVPTGPAPTDYTVVARGDGADLATLLRVVTDHLDAP